MKDLFELDYFSILDIAWSILCFVLIMVSVNISKKKYIDTEFYQYYTANIYLKLFLSLVYAVYYIIIVDGGDTLAYWDCGLKMNNLFWKSPAMFFDEMFNDPDMMMNYAHFDLTTGYPPRWIYLEKESWFIAKIMTVFTFFTFKSYIVTTLILAYLSSLASWKLFQLIHSFQLNSIRNVAICVIFIPSVSFWCTGVNKDTVVLFASLYIIHHSFQILLLDRKTSAKNFIWIAIFVYVLLQTREFMLTTIAVPLIFTYSARLSNRYRQNRFAFFTIRFFSIIVGFLFFYFQGNSLTNSEKLEEAAIIQKDLANNETYEGARYDLGITDYSSAGMLSAFPVAVIAGFYRPFIWEAGSPSLISNGLESAFFMYLTFIFFRSGSLSKINLIRKHEFYIFAFFFALLLAYMSGLTSGLLGVLVRFKAPLIPFLLALLTIDPKLLTSENKKKLLENKETIDDDILEKTV